MNARLKSKQGWSISEDLEKLVAELLKNAITDTKMTLDDKLAIIKEARGIEALKMKRAEEEMGRGFDWSGDDA